MAPWLSRAEREARGQAERETTSLRSTAGSGGVSQATSSSSTARSERRRSRLSCGISSGSSSQRRRPSDQVLDERGESRGASTPSWGPKRRRPSDKVKPRLTKRRRPSDQVESAGASSPGQKPRRQSDALESIADLVGPASETREAHLLRHGGGQLTCPRCSAARRGPPPTDRAWRPQALVVASFGWRSGQPGRAMRGPWGASSAPRMSVGRPHVEEQGSVNTVCVFAACRPTASGSTRIR